MTSENKKTIPWTLSAIFLLFSLAIVLAGSFYYKSQITRIYSDQENNLASITTLKISQITQWHRERLGDAAVIRDNEPLINSIKKYFEAAAQPEIKAELTRWIQSLSSEFDYSGVLLVDTATKVRLSLLPSDTIAGEEIRTDLEYVIKNHTILMTDLHRSKFISYVHFDLLIPLMDRTDKGNKPFGILILRIDPDKRLFPLIQSWPTPSKSSETLLVRKDGDSVLYLNELRHRQNTALKLKAPLSNKDLLASKVVRGFEGIAEGIDYRNIPVVGYLTRINDFQWYMVAKVDKEEIQMPFKKYLFVTILVIILLILIIGSVFGSWIWNQQMKFYRNQLKNEEKLLESEELFRKLFENMLNGFAYCKMLYNEGKPYDFIYLNVNEAFETLTGLINVKGRNVSDVIPGIQDADPEILERYGRVALTGIPEVFEIFVESLKMWFSISVYSPQKEYFVAVFDVITERKKADEALRESEDKFKYIFDHSVIGKSITLPSGEIQVNQAFSDMLGYSQEELETTKWQDITHPDEIEISQQYINLMLTGEKDSMRFVKRYIHKNGSIVWTEIGTALRRDIFGNPLYFLTAINNITDRKNAESEIEKLNEELEDRVKMRTEQLEAANKELEAFSYSVSHDLRAPLRSVHGFTKILIEDYQSNLDEEGKRICGIISSSATQMGELIDDLLSFSRIGRSSMNPSVIDMKKMAGLIFEGMTSPTERERIKLHVDRLPKAYGDVTLFGQVWTNLLSNAIKYTSKNAISEITIGSSVAGKMITYYIKDNGVGFDMQYAHKLFGVFQRLHSEAEFEGNGVGLAIIQRIILKHGGKVWAEGEVGKGATFYFSLPALRPASSIVRH